MSFIDSYNFELLKNEAEQMVLSELEKQLQAQNPDLCRCNECIVDMAAIALNMVKPLYRFSLLGTQYAAQAINEQSYAENLRTAVSQAIEKVKSNPSHD
ncbi:MAG: late competence development ComFB family protein [Treponema sp.]|jgi:competence protein ComFB|nr:late competence development ComFB family protein [Treponema sp.]